MKMRISSECVHELTEPYGEIMPCRHCGRKPDVVLDGDAGKTTIDCSGESCKCSASSTVSFTNLVKTWNEYHKERK